VAQAKEIASNWLAGAKQTSGVELRCRTHVVATDEDDDGEGEGEGYGIYAAR